VSYASDISSISSAASDTDVSSVSGYLKALTEPAVCDVMPPTVKGTSNTTENGILTQLSMQLDMSSDESSKETDNENGSLAATKSNDSKKFEQCKYPRKHYSGYFTRSADVPAKRAKGGARTPKKPAIKDLYQKYLKTMKVMNSKHYDDLLCRSRYLQSLEDKMPPGSVESVKKNIFNQNMFLDPVPYLDRIVVRDSERLEQKVVEKAANTWLQVIADDNSLSLDELISKIFCIMTLSEAKISTLVFIGESNS